MEMYFVNEFGNGTAIFRNLVRGEFHSTKPLNLRPRRGLERDPPGSPRGDRYPGGP